jgi:predicted RNA-binding protein
MCLSNVYRQNGNDLDLICEYVTGIHVSGNTVRMVDIVGNETSVNGSIQNIDLVKNTVVIESNGG